MIREPYIKVYRFFTLMPSYHNGNNKKGDYYDNHPYGFYEQAEYSLLVANASVHFLSIGHCWVKWQFSGTVL